MDRPMEGISLDEKSDLEITYERFDVFQRIEHIVFLLSFTILGITGLVQKFSSAAISESIIFTLGGIQTTRIIHRSSAVIMMAVSIFHIIDVLYRVYVLRVPWTMIPVVEDLKHVLDDISYYFGGRKHKAYYGRYSYAEKMEYLAVVWGTVIMAITGFMMWNPISTARYLPGEIIPAAKAAHGAEAILAILAIIIWHFYHVHLRHFNKSMFTGQISREEMKHEHPEELDEIESGEGYKPPPAIVIKQRNKFYYPVALLLSIGLGFSLYKFVTFEETAITTLPQGETAEIFVPVTPTPLPTITPIPTALPGDQVSTLSWRGRFETLFDNRCGSCHGVTEVGGLSLSTYQNALEGGNSGPAIVPGDPDASTLVQVQSIGGHPGQLTIEELNAVIEWINVGAPEQ
jgi:cytochrome b subunit of formate dehydrogenase